MKKTLAILLALVLCFSAVVMIACNKCDHNYVDGVCTKCGEPDPDYKPGGPNGGDDVDVPVVDGKITFYFTLSDSSVAIPSYASPYFTGGQLDWGTGTDSLEFTKLGDTKVYYVQVAYDATKTQADEYAIVLGYNASSNLPNDKIGLKWVDDYKSDECAEYSYPANAKFTVAAGAKSVNLGKHTFSTEVAEPIRINTTVAITFESALPTTAEVYIIGTINEWNTTDLTKSKATADADRKVYKLALTDVLCSTHYYKILVFLDGTTNVIKPVDKDGKEADIWNWQKADAATQADGDDDAPAAKKYLAYIEISAGDDNLPVDIAKRHNNSTVDLAGTVSETQYDKDGTTPIVEKHGIDILTAANLTEVEGKQDKLDAEGNPVLDKDGNKVQEGNGIWATKYIVKSNKTLTVTFKDALPEAAMVYVIGSFLDSGWKTTVGQARMTIAEDRKSASVTYTMLPGEYKFNVLVVHKDIELGADDSSVVQPIWDYGTKVYKDGDAAVTVTGFADGVVNLFAAAQDVPEVTPPVTLENVVLKVKFDNALSEGKHVYLTGVGGWDNLFELTAKDDGVTYTYTIDSLVAKTWSFLLLVEDKVCATKAELTYTRKYAKDGVVGANEDASVTVAKDAKEVDLFGETVLVAPAASSKLASVTIQVTFSEALAEGKNVWFAGALTSWGGTDDNKMTANADRTVFTLTLTDISTGEYEFKLCVNETFDWNKCLCSNYPDNWGGENAIVKIAADSTTVALLAATVTLPA